MKTLRRFTLADTLAMDLVKRIVARRHGIPHRDVTHMYVIMSRPVPGDRNSVMVAGVPCEHMTGILNIAIGKGEETRRYRDIGPCPHKID